MRRRVFTFLAGLSAILFVASVALRERMLFANDRIIFTRWDEANRQWHAWELHGQDGCLDIIRYHLTAMPGEDVSEPRRLVGQGRLSWDLDQWPRLHFADKLWPWLTWGHGSQYMGISGRPGQRLFEQRGIAVRVWPVAICSAILPVMYWRDRRRDRKRRRIGLCLVCGYDLRESPQRCPECGEENAIAKIAKEQRSQRAVQGSEG